MCILYNSGKAPRLVNYTYIFAHPVNTFWPSRELSLLIAQNFSPSKISSCKLRKKNDVTILKMSNYDLISFRNISTPERETPLDTPKLDCLWNSRLLGGGHSTFFFGGYVPRGFPKVGSRERIFLEKCGVLGAKIQKFCALRAEILAQNKAENAFFLFTKLQTGGTWAAHWWQIGRLGSADCTEKRGSCTFPYPLSMSVPPGVTLATKKIHMRSISYIYITGVTIMFYIIIEGMKWCIIKIIFGQP